MEVDGTCILVLPGLMHTYARDAGGAFSVTHSGQNCTAALLLIIC